MLVNRVAYCPEAEGRAAGCLDARRKPRTPSAVGVADLLQSSPPFILGAVRGAASQFRRGLAAQLGLLAGELWRMTPGKGILVTRGRDRGASSFDLKMNARRFGRGSLPHELPQSFLPGRFRGRGLPPPPQAIILSQVCRQAMSELCESWRCQPR